MLQSACMKHYKPRSKYCEIYNLLSRVLAIQLVAITPAMDMLFLNRRSIRGASTLTSSVPFPLLRIAAPLWPNLARNWWAKQVSSYVTSKRPLYNLRGASIIKESTRNYVQCKIAKLDEMHFQCLQNWQATSVRCHQTISKCTQMHSESLPHS